jgi:hypothetical protein
MAVAVGLSSLDGAPRWLIAEARADDAKTTAMVFVDPPEAEADVARALGPSVRVVSSKKLADALAKKGVKGKLHATLGDAAKRQALADDLRKLGLDVDRVVVVSVKPAKGGGKEIRALTVSKSGAAGGAATVVLAPSDDRVAGLQKALGIEPTTASPPVATTATATPEPPPPAVGAAGSSRAQRRRRSHGRRHLARVSRCDARSDRRVRRARAVGATTELHRCALEQRAPVQRHRCAEPHPRGRALPARADVDPGAAGSRPGGERRDGDRALVEDAERRHDVDALPALSGGSSLSHPPRHPRSPGGARARN